MYDTKLTFPDTSNLSSFERDHLSKWSASQDLSQPNVFGLAYAMILDFVGAKRAFLFRKDPILATRADTLEHPNKTLNVVVTFNDLYSQYKTYAHLSKTIKFLCSSARREGKSFRKQDGHKLDFILALISEGVDYNRVLKVQDLQALHSSMMTYFRSRSMGVDARALRIEQDRVSSWDEDTQRLIFQLCKRISFARTLENTLGEGEADPYQGARVINKRNLALYTKGSEVYGEDLDQAISTLCRYGYLYPADRVVASLSEVSNPTRLFGIAADLPYTREEVVDLLRISLTGDDEGYVNYLHSIFKDKRERMIPDYEGLQLFYDLPQTSRGRKDFRRKTLRRLAFDLYQIDMIGDRVLAPQSARKVQYEISCDDYEKPLDSSDELLDHLLTEAEKEQEIKRLREEIQSLKEKLNEPTPQRAARRSGPHRR